MRRETWLIITLLGLVPYAAADEFKWRFDAWDGPSFPVRMYVPQNVNADSPIVIVLHGQSRDAERYFQDWVKQADSHDLIIVTPEFTQESFRGSSRYNLGHVFDSDTGAVRDESLWTFSAIEPLFDAVVARLGGEQSQYILYGHSAGAQFVHRYLYYKPDARVRRYIAANAGWYTVPVYDFDYPYGLTKSTIRATDLERIFSSKLVILLGDQDRDPEDKSLRKTKEAKQQGPHRLARGQTMYQVGKSTAEAKALDFAWTLLVVKGAGHVNAQMTPAAAVVAAQ